MTIGPRVRERRKALRLSQEQLASQAGLTWSAIQRLEAGQVTDPHYSTLSSIANVLDTTIADLVGEGPAAPKVSAPPSGPKETTPRFLTLNADFLRTICESMAGHYKDLADRDVPPSMALGWWDVAPYDAGYVLAAVDVLLEGVQDGSIIDDEDEILPVLRAAYRLAHFADALWSKGAEALSQEIAAATLETQFWNLTSSLELTEEQKETIVS
jgi:transcriptional regulator with XRE-family HTH domain